MPKWKTRWLLVRKLKKCKQKLKSFLDMKFDSKAQQAVPSPNTENVKAGVELPKLLLKKFSGEKKNLE